MAFLKRIEAGIRARDSRALKVVAILSYSVSDVLILTKKDVAPYFDFDFDACKRRARQLNPNIEIFEVSAKTGAGFDAWEEWLARAILENKGN